MKLEQICKKIHKNKKKITNMKKAIKIVVYYAYITRIKRRLLKLSKVEFEINRNPLESYILEPVVMRFSRQDLSAYDEVNLVNVYKSWQLRWNKQTFINLSPVLLFFFFYIRNKLHLFYYKYLPVFAIKVKTPIFVIKMGISQIFSNHFILLDDYFMFNEITADIIIDFCLKFQILI